MAAYMRVWRKRQRALDEFLRESESHSGLENHSDSDDIPLDSPCLQDIPLDDVVDKDIESHRTARSARSDGEIGSQRSEGSSSKKAGHRSVSTPPTTPMKDYKGTSTSSSKNADCRSVSTPPTARKHYKEWGVERESRTSGSQHSRASSGSDHRGSFGSHCTKSQHRGSTTPVSRRSRHSRERSTSARQDVHRSRSRSSNRSRHSVSQDSSDSRHSIRSTHSSFRTRAYSTSHSQRSRHDRDHRSHSQRSRHDRDHRSHSQRSRHDKSRDTVGHAAVETGDLQRGQFPMPTGVFQKKALAIWAEIRQDVCRLARAGPETSETSTQHVDTMDSLEEFDREELRLGDEAAFKTLVLRLTRIGGKDTRECVHKVLSRLMSNWLMTKFNLRGTGGKKQAFLETAVFRATKDAVLQSQPRAKEEDIKQYVGDHLKHAKKRKGGKGPTTED